ncbi:MAG TPA: hypothetical protein VMU94_13390 [Streptosporangiaceae bacterium]|nr:hypothetical protein [Streptosporangiaceae bacterium]
MKGLIKLVLCGVILVATVTGCGGQAAGRPATATGCAAFAVDAVRRQVPVGRQVAAGGLPAPCRGLGPAGLGQAVRIAVGQLALHADKARRRHLAGLARPHLAYLIDAAQREAAARAAARSRGPSRGGTGSGSGPAPPGRHLPVGVAALIAWLLTAGSGAVLVGKRLTRGSGGPGSGRPGSGRPGSSGPGSGRAGPAGRLPAVLVSHFGLAAAGLAVWSGYLLSGWAPLAWAALGILLPVAGLGMATLVLTIPDPGTGPGPLPRGKAPVVVIAGHGVLATLTLLLALLAAVTAVLPR